MKATVTTKQGMTCTTDDIEITLTCQDYNDYYDGRNAYKYTYDKNIGLLVDDNDDVKNPVQIAATGRQSYFGPFFSATTSNLNKVKLLLLLLLILILILILVEM